MKKIMTKMLVLGSVLSSMTPISVLANDVSNGKDNSEYNGVVTPLYEPIPYEYINTQFIPNGQLPDVIKDMKKANNDVADVTFWSSFIPFITPQMKIVGHLANNDTIKKTEYYKNAYDNGMGIQIITRLNPDYDGYNAKTLVENHNQCIKKKYEGSFIHDRSKDKLIHNEE